jgi:predicted nucleotidyltransferase
MHPTTNEKSTNVLTLLKDQVSFYNVSDLIIHMALYKDVYGTDVVLYLMQNPNQQNKKILENSDVSISWQRTAILMHHKNDIDERVLSDLISIELGDNAEDFLQHIGL